MPGDTRFVSRPYQLPKYPGRFIWNAGPGAGFWHRNASTEDGVVFMVVCGKRVAWFGQIAIGKMRSPKCKECYGG